MKTTYNTGASRIFYCANCHYGVDDIFEGAMRGDKEEQDNVVELIEKGKEWNYCPNCGAQIIDE